MAIGAIGPAMAGGGGGYVSGAVSTIKTAGSWVNNNILSENGIFGEGHDYSGIGGTQQAPLLLKAAVEVNPLVSIPNAGMSIFGGSNIYGQTVSGFDRFVLAPFSTYSGGTMFLPSGGATQVSKLIRDALITNPSLLFGH